jgi:CIC family chloride channel protein
LPACSGLPFPALVVELTGALPMVLPIISCMASTMVAQALGGQPIYTELGRR